MNKVYSGHPTLEELELITDLFPTAKLGGRSCNECLNNNGIFTVDILRLMLKTLVTAATVPE